MINRLGVAVLAMGTITACLGPVNDVSEVNYEQFFQRVAPDLIRSYRLPEGDDMSYWGVDSDSYFYKTLDDTGSEKAPYWTKGDFNGDGVIDRCYLLFSNTSDTVGLFAFISVEDGGYQVSLLEPNADMTMGISTHQIHSGEQIINLFRFEGHGVGSYIWRHDLDSFKFLEEVWPPYD